MVDASVSRIVFLREGGQFAEVDLLTATPGPVDQPVQMIAALGPGEASAWAWTNVRIMDRRDGRPQAVARCLCDRVLQAARRIADEHAPGIRALLDGHGRPLADEFSMFVHGDRFGDAFLLLCFERLPGPGILPGTMLPVILQLPAGMLPPAACGECATCRALAGAQAAPAAPEPADHGYAVVAAAQEPADGGPAPDGPSPQPPADEPASGPAGTPDGQED
jgi:hypothetical protein